MEKEMFHHMLMLTFFKQDLKKTNKQKNNVMNLTELDPKQQQKQQKSNNPTTSSLQGFKLTL